MSARKYSIEDMQKAIAAVRTGKISVNKAAKMHNVSFTSLWRRIKDYVPDNCIRPGPKPVLGTTLEAKLADAINEMQGMGFRLIRKEILDLACKIDSLLPTPAFKGKLPSNRWMQRFAARHKINLDHPGDLPDARSGMSREEVLDKFFETFINKVRLEFTSYTDMKRSNQLLSESQEQEKIEDTQTEPLLYCDTVLETTQDVNLESNKLNKKPKRKLGESSGTTAGPSTKKIFVKSVENINKSKKQSQVKLHENTSKNYGRLYSDRETVIQRVNVSVKEKKDDEDCVKNAQEEEISNDSIDIVHSREESRDSYFDNTSMSSDDESHSDGQEGSKPYIEDGFHTPKFGGLVNEKTTSEQLSDNVKKGKIFKCDECHKGFISKTELKKHFIIHKGIIHLCDQCGKFFSDKATLVTHMLLHKGVGYKCTVCGVSFSWKCSLETHMSSHKDLLSHVCKECGLECTTKSALTTHMFLHRGVEFRCKVCEKCFSRKQTLQKHENKIHKGFPWY